MSTRAKLLAVLVAVIWGVNFLAVKEGVKDVPPLLFAAVRFVVVIMPLIFFLPRPAPWRHLLALGTTMYVGQFAFFYVSIKLGMPIGLSSLVMQSSVMVTTVVAALFLHEKPTLAQGGATALGALGLAVIATGRAESTPLLALVLTVLGATSWGIGNVVSRRLAIPGGLAVTVWASAVVPLPMLLLSLLIEGPQAVAHGLTHFTMGAALSTAFTAYISTLVGYGLWNSLLGRYPAAAVVPYALLVPVVGLAVAWIVVGERPNPYEWAGGLMLLMGVAGVSLAGTWGRRRTALAQAREH